MIPIDPLLTAVERLRWAGCRAAGIGRLGPDERYFEPGEGRPGDPRYLAELDELNERFEEYLEPAGVGAPPPGRVRREGEFVTFPSARPCGDPRVDRVVVRLYPAPPDAGEGGVLFHHWVYAGRWSAIDYLLAPLASRFRVAVMVAPHHMMRRRPGFRPGEGMLNQNPRRLFEALRQWQADHAATRALLRRDFGFERLVVVGYSLGAYGLLLARLFGLRDPAVAVCVTNNYQRGVREGAATAHLARRILAAGFTWESFRRATRALHLARHAGRIGGDGLTFVRARYDRIEPSDSLDELIRALAPERLVFLPGGHSTAALFRHRIAREVAARMAAAYGTPRTPAPDPVRVRAEA